MNKNIYIHNLANKFGYIIKRKYPRPMFKILNEKGFKNMVGVEIGVAFGEHAKAILKYNSIKKLYLIDPYKKYDDFKDSVVSDTYKNLNVTNQEHLNLIKEHANNSLCNEKVEFIEELSSEAFIKVPDNLDFVYIDGNHKYKYIKQDIRLYYPKLKKGGVIGGHDWNYPDVARAILDLFWNKKINAVDNDWWVVK